MREQGPLKRALLIGIDNYRYPDFIRSLNGCVNDSDLIHSLLRDQFGFPESNIRRLRNEEAGRDAILAALDTLVAETGEDDIVVVHYAGHGSQMTDREGDEPSGYDSTIMPWDTQGWQGENRDITDDEIHLRLQDLGAKTRYITLIFDCCHSGTITRDDFGVEARSMPRDERPVSELPPSPIPPERRQGAAATGPSGWVPLTDRYVLIAGCRDEEVSYEYRPPEGDGKITHGALTYFLSQELSKAAATGGSNVSYRDVFERAAAQVNAANQKQHPQMEGRADREIFGVGDLEPMTYVRVIDPVDANSVTLAAGAAFGVTVGSTYAVYPQGTKRESEVEAVAELEITDVSAVTSRAKILPGVTRAVSAGMRAVETKHSYGDLAMRVQLSVPEGREADAAAMRERIEASTLLRIVDSADAAAMRLYLIPARETAGPSDPARQLGALASDTWVAVDETGQIPMPHKSLDEVEDVASNLEHLARYRQALALDNTSPESEFRGNFELDLLRRSPDGKWVDAKPDADTGQTVFEVGESVAFRVTNRLPKTAFVTLLDFEPDGGVSVIYPQDRAAVPIRPAIASGAGFFNVGTEQLPDGKDPFFMESLPDIFPYNAPPEEGGVDSAIETIKLVVTSEEVDFSFLEQGSFRSDASALEMLWASAAVPDTRKVGSRTPPTPKEDWTTVVRSFVLRRPSVSQLSAEPLALGGVTLSAKDVSGTVRVHPWGSDRTDAVLQPTDDLTSALQDSGIDVKQTIEVAGATVTPTRSAGGPPRVELSLRDPGPDFGQMVLGTDEAGAMTWHFAPQAEPGDEGTRGGAVRRYSIAASVPAAPEGAVPTRGLIGAAGRKLLKELVFPRMDKVLGPVGNAFAGAWEKHNRPYRLRSFTPDDYSGADGSPIDAAGWERLGAGRSLLLLHGTFSRANSAFGSMPREFVEALNRRYENRVFAFDHFTLSHDPSKNIDELIAAMPSDVRLDCDIICHSRGGLVARVLTEQQSELSLGSRTVRIGKVIFAGAPNAGTTLADGNRIGDLIDTFTNLANFVPDVGVSDTIAGVIAVAKQLAVGALQGLPGIQAMAPDGKFFKQLNTGDRSGDTHYFAISSDYTPSDPGLLEFAKNRLMDAVFKGSGNDLVVPTEGVFDANGSGFFPINDTLVLRESRSIGHTEYFGNQAVREKIEEWLGG